jgi:hypothetical protein
MSAVNTVNRVTKVNTVQTPENHRRRRRLSGRHEGFGYKTDLIVLTIRAKIL